MPLILRDYTAQYILLWMAVKIAPLSQARKRTNKVL